jgi:hypothetical protein
MNNKYFIEYMKEVNRIELKVNKMKNDMIQNVSIFIGASLFVYTLWNIVLEINLKLR